MHNRAYNPPFTRRQPTKRTSSSVHRLASAWAKIRDEIACEHRSILARHPVSPRIRPSLAAAIGTVLR
jgi:hypothetical protein